MPGTQLAVYGRGRSCVHKAGRGGQAKACLRADEGGVGECRSSQGSQGWARVGRDASSQGPRTPDSLAALRPPWPIDRGPCIRGGLSGCPDLDKNPGSPGSLACKAGHRPGSTTLRAQLLQRQVRSATQYCDLAQCYCGMWIEAPGNSIITLYSSCDVWRGQGERPASDQVQAY